MDYKLVINMCHDDLQKELNKILDDCCDFDYDKDETLLPVSYVVYKNPFAIHQNVVKYYFPNFVCNIIKKYNCFDDEKIKKWMITFDEIHNTRKILQKTCHTTITQIQKYDIDRKQMMLKNFLNRSCGKLLLNNNVRLYIKNFQNFLCEEFEKDILYYDFDTFYINDSEEVLEKIRNFSEIILCKEEYYKFFVIYRKKGYFKIDSENECAFIGGGNLSMIFEKITELCPEFLNLIPTEFLLKNI
jgi:hypothetical protein